MNDKNYGANSCSTLAAAPLPLSMDLAEQLRGHQEKTAALLDALEARLSHCLSDMSDAGKEGPCDPRPAFAAPLARVLDRNIDVQNALNGRIAALAARVSI